jgi:hypothetical protein
MKKHFSLCYLFHSFLFKDAFNGSPVMPSLGVVFIESINVKNMTGIGSGTSFRQCSYMCMKEVSKPRKVPPRRPLSVPGTSLTRAECYPLYEQVRCCIVTDRYLLANLLNFIAYTKHSCCLFQIKLLS